uniref:Protein kinase domain-containing protein n=1 Tax=Panagrolaimus davidi TaxID=227884 RepID=A0A914PVP2_9BILA
MISHECIIQDDKTTCHESCKTCSNSSFCGNLNACTSCFPGDYKISEFFDDLVFQCVAIFALFKRQWQKHTADDFKTLENGLIKPLKFSQQCEKKEAILEMIRDVQSFKTGKYLGGGSYSKVYEDESRENVEISDFGCAFDLEHDHEQKFSGTITHMAYELLKKSINANFSATASKASDVWSFAVTVWQIFQKSDKLPSDFVKVGDIIANHENGKKLPKPILLPEIIWRYNLLRCFDLDPISRPSMAELHKTLIKYQSAPIVSTI